MQPGVLEIHLGHHQGVIAYLGAMNLPCGGASNDQSTRKGAANRVEMTAVAEQCRAAKDQNELVLAMDG